MEKRAILDSKGLRTSLRRKTELRAATPAVKLKTTAMFRETFAVVEKIGFSNQQILSKVKFSNSNPSANH